jgi:hypothetical protein
MLRPEEGTATIAACLPRKTTLVRKRAGRASTPQLLAANLDVVFLVTSLNAELNVLRAVNNARFVRNSLLPFLTLDYSYNVNGLGPSLGDSFRLLGDKDFEDHRVGVRLEVPLGNQQARNRYRASLAQRMETIATKELRAQTITSETLAFADAMEINYQLMLTAQARVNGGVDNVPCVGPCVDLPGIEPFDASVAQLGLFGTTGNAALLVTNASWHTFGEPAPNVAFELKVATPSGVPGEARRRASMGERSSAGSAGP